MSFAELPPSLDLLNDHYETSTPIDSEVVKHADSDSEGANFTDSDSDSSIQDYDESRPVARWEKFDILNILIDAKAIERGFNRKIGGIYRRVQDENRNSEPVWRNRFSYEISKTNKSAKCFDVCMPNMKTVMRIEEVTYSIWVLSGEKFHLVQDESIQFFFEYVDEAEAQLDHFIETYFKEEAKTSRLQPSFASPTPRSPNNMKWSKANLFKFKQTDSERARARSVESGIPDFPSLKQTRSVPMSSAHAQSLDGLNMTRKMYRQFSEPIRPQNIDENRRMRQQVLFAEDDMWLGLPRRPSLQRTSSKETKEAIKKHRGERTFVNQYMIDKTLATTGLGVVKLATDIINKEQVVLKIFERQLLNKRDKIFRPGRRKLLGTKKRKQERSIMDNIMREMEIMKNLRHPNIVSAVETIDDTEADQIFLVLEYVNGGTLTDYLSEPENDMTIVRCFARDLLHGIEYLHNKRIIHGDIKPDNIFIKEMPDGKRVLKIGDFGVSKCMDDYNSFMSKIETTPAYQAPEELGNSNFKAWPRDIWSVGIVIYQLAFGKNPFMSQNGALHLVFERIKQTVVEYPKNCEPALQDLLTKMLQKNPANRITIEDIKIHDFMTDHGEYGWHDEIPQEQTLPNLNIDTISNNSEDSISSVSDLLPRPTFEKCVPTKSARKAELEAQTKAQLVEHILELEARLLLTDTKE